MNAEENTKQTETPQPKGRREFVKAAAKAAVVAPAVALLLSARTKDARAALIAYGAPD